jgi:hypothetical protein
MDHKYQRRGSSGRPLKSYLVLYLTQLNCFGFFFAYVSQCRVSQISAVILACRKLAITEHLVKQTTARKAC